MNSKLGTLHLFSGIELRPSKSEVESFFKRGAPGWLLESGPNIAPPWSVLTGPPGSWPPTGIPNLAWATFFGDNFAAEVDVARLVAQGFAVERVGEGYLATVTDALFDVKDDFAAFSRRRAELKSLFRDGLFLIKEEPDATAG